MEFITEATPMNRRINNKIVQKLKDLSETPKLVFEQPNFEITLKRHLLFFKRAWLNLTLPNSEKILFPLNNHPRLQENIDKVSKITLHTSNDVLLVVCYK